MTQTARPMQDVSEGGWTPTPLWSRLGGATPNSTALVTSSNDPQSDTFEMQLSNVAFPGPGPQTLTVQLAQTTVESLPVTISLLQGSQVLASRTVQPTPSFRNYTLTLSQQQIGQITDYSNLRVRINAQTQTTIGRLRYAAVALQWSLMVSGFGVDCSQLNGDFILTYAGGCTWKSPHGIWKLMPLSSDHWWLTAETIFGPMIYKIPIASFNCLGRNTLNNSSYVCNNAPTTLTINPV